MNTLKKEREQKSPEDNYPWLDPHDDWRHIVLGHNHWYTINSSDITISQCVEAKQ